MKYYFMNRFIKLDKHEATDASNLVYGTDGFTDRVQYNDERSEIDGTDYLVVDEDKLDSRILFFIGYFANRVGVNDIKDKIIFLSNNKKASNNLLLMIQKGLNFRNLKYRCFNLDKIEPKDIIFMGILSNNNRTLIGYRNEGSKESEYPIIKLCFNAIFTPSELESELNDHKIDMGDYMLDVNDYNSFRKIPVDAMMTLVKYKL